MTPEHKALVERANEHIAMAKSMGNFGVASKLVEELASALSAQCAQPQAGEPVANGVFRNGEMIGFVGLGEEFKLPEDTDERRLLYASPHPANPAQVTDAVKQAIAEAMMWMPSEDGPTYKEVSGRVYAALAAIGAGGQAGAEPRKGFPILGSGGQKIDWQLVADHGGQAQKNHYQSVEQLAARGGLSWCELHAVLHDKPWQKMDENDAIAACRALEARYLFALSQPHPADERVVATHRHKKRGTEYVLLGIGKIQSEDWFEVGTPVDRVDMREVAIYRSVEDGSLWVRPREEFEDGRFEAIAQEGRKDD